MKLFNEPSVLRMGLQTVPVISEIFIDVWVYFEVTIDFEERVFYRDPNIELYHGFPKLFDEFSKINENWYKKQENLGVVEA